MASRDRESRVFNRVQQIVRQQLYKLLSAGAFLIASLTQVFGIDLTPIGDAIVGITTSLSFISVLLLLVVFSQIILYREVRNLSVSIENTESSNQYSDSDSSAGADESAEMETDGGDPEADRRTDWTADRPGPDGETFSDIVLLFIAGLAGLIISQELDISPTLVVAVFVLVAYVIVRRLD